MISLVAEGKNPQQLKTKSQNNKEQKNVRKTINQLLAHDLSKILSRLCWTSSQLLLTAAELLIFTLPHIAQVLRKCETMVVQEVYLHHVPDLSWSSSSSRCCCLFLFVSAASHPHTDRHDTVTVNQSLLGYVTSE